MDPHVCHIAFSCRGCCWWPTQHHFLFSPSFLECCPDFVTVHTLSLREPSSYDGGHHSHTIQGLRGELLIRKSQCPQTCVHVPFPPSVPAPSAHSPATEDQLPEEARAERQTELGPWWQHWSGLYLTWAHPTSGPVTGNNKCHYLWARLSYSFVLLCTKNILSDIWVLTLDTGDDILTICRSYSNCEYICICNNAKNYTV